MIVKIKEQQIDWGITRINGPLAWRSNFTGKGVKVAVVDTGIAPHEDLVISGGKSFVGYTDSHVDDNGHGTHVAGIIGAKNNNTGIVGVAPDSLLYSVKVLDESGNGYLSNLVSGIDWAITNKMDIINLSVGTDFGASSLKAAVDKAYNNGIILVAAAGNDGAGNGDTVDYPARYDSVIAVSATNTDNNIASFSSIGNTVEVAAPGSRILSTHLNNTYQTSSGTSMASPFVAGHLALIKEANLSLTVQQMRKIVQQNVHDLGSGGRDDLFGYGLIQTSYGINLYGTNRYETSVRVSKFGWPDRADTIVLGRGDIPVDALTGSVLARQQNAPLLLTKRDELPSSIRNEIARINPSTVYLLGGEGAISASIADHLRENGYEVIRVAGTSRYETSVRIAEQVPQGTSVIIATGNATSPDALSIAPYAGMNQIPILFSSPNGLTTEVLTFINERKPLEAFIIGGEGAVPSIVEEQLRNAGVLTIERIAGTNRYETSLAIANRFQDEYNNQDIYFSSGKSFIDALPGSPIAAINNAPLLLVDHQVGAMGEINTWVNNRNANRAQLSFLGGYGVLPIEVRALLQNK
nr:S8 family serine peptidase [Salirhabdus salicampi]